MVKHGTVAAEVFVPGRPVVVDESMSGWLGDQAWNTERGHPHVQIIDRKPTLIGAELKTIACCDSGIMLSQEIVEAKENMRTKEFTEKYDSSGVGWLLRLTSAANLWRSERVTGSVCSNVSEGHRCIKRRRLI